MTDASETTKYEQVMPRTGGRDLRRIVYTADEIASQVRRMGEEIGNDAVDRFEKLQAEIDAALPAHAPAEHEREEA